MLALQSKAHQPATGNILLTTGLGFVFGLLFALPPALALRSVGLRWFPFGIAALLPGICASTLLAYLAVKFVFGAELPDFYPSLIRRRSLPQSPVRDRLAEAAARIEGLENERIRRRDCRYEKRVEERLIWNELLDLELQDVDEQIKRICDSHPSKGG
jgi:hypothetical protein